MMTSRLIFSLVGILALLAAPGAFAQKAPGKTEGPVLEGSLKRKQILGVTPEWREIYQDYQPEAASLEMIQAISQALSEDLKVDVVVGTWCSDSRREVPRFMKMQRMLRKERLKVSFWGVDRTKESPPEAVAGKSIEKVPTFIVYYKGEELGRIIEKPEISVEADLAEILSRAGRD